MCSFKKLLNNYTKEQIDTKSKKEGVDYGRTGNCFKFKAPHGLRVGRRKADFDCFIFYQSANGAGGYVGCD